MLRLLLCSIGIATQFLHQGDITLRLHCQKRAGSTPVAHGTGNCIPPVGESLWFEAGTHRYTVLSFRPHTGAAGPCPAPSRPWNMTSNSRLFAVFVPKSQTIFSISLIDFCTDILYDTWDWGFSFHWYLSRYTA